MNRNSLWKLCPLLLFVSTLLHAQEYADQKIAWDSDTNVVIVMKGGKFGIMSYGKELIPVKYKIEHFYDQVKWDGRCFYSDGAAFVLSLDGKYGVMNNKGTIIVPFEYDYIAGQRNNETDKLDFAGVEKNGKCAICDGGGNVITPFEYDAFFGYYIKQGYTSMNARIALRKGAKALFYDPSTKKTLDALPNDPSGVESKIVEYRGQKGIVSHTGEILLACGYDEIRSANGSEFENRSQLVILRKSKSYGAWIYEAGFVVPVEYENLKGDFSHGSLFFMAMFNKKYGLMDDSGKKLTPFDFDDISVEEDVIIGTRGDAKFSISSKGKVEPLKK